MVSQPTCKTCIHWHKEATSKAGEHGECRRYPRSNTTVKVIFAHEWCGEHPDMIRRAKEITGENIYRIDVDKDTGFLDVCKEPLSPVEDTRR